MLWPLLSDHTADCALATGRNSDAMRFGHTIHIGLQFRDAVVKGIYVFHAAQSVNETKELRIGFQKRMT